MSEASYEFTVVCEARADRDTACGLADRVLLEEVSWLESETLNSIRRWRGSRPEADFLKWASVRDECQRVGLKGIFGKFGGQSREHGAKNDAKRALQELTQGDMERERACLEETPLAVLAERGKQLGLAEYLMELRERLVPVLGGQ